MIELNSGSSTPDSKTKLLVSGDSWTSCWPLEKTIGRRLGWPSIVSTYFGFDLIDKSRSGASNDRIYRKAFDGMLDGVDLSIVFLTSWTRFETGATYGEKPGRIYQHLPADRSSSQAFKLFFNGYLNYTNLLRQIISLQCLARQQNTQCFFLDTFENNLYLDISEDDFKKILNYNTAVYDNMSDQRILEKLSVVKKLEQQIDRSMFISDRSYQALIGDCKLEEGHPIEDGHKKIADIVINFLKGINYGKTI